MVNNPAADVMLDACCRLMGMNAGVLPNSFIIDARRVIYRVSTKSGDRVMIGSAVSASTSRLDLVESIRSSRWPNFHVFGQEGSEN